MIEVEQFICRADNFGVLLHDGASELTVAIDAPDAMAIGAALTPQWAIDLLRRHGPWLRRPGEPPSPT